jgi:hypothetical protein
MIEQALVLHTVVGGRTKRLEKPFGCLVRPGLVSTAGCAGSRSTGLICEFANYQQIPSQ